MSFEDDLHALFPDDRDDLRVREGFAFVRTMGIQMKVLGQVLAESFSSHMMLRTDKGKVQWKVLMMRDLMDASAWLSRLNSTIASLIVDLHAHVVRHDPAFASGVGLAGGLKGISEQLSFLIAEAERDEGSGRPVGSGAVPKERGHSGGGVGAQEAASPGLVDDGGFEDGIIADAKRILGG